VPGRSLDAQRLRERRVEIRGELEIYRIPEPAASADTASSNSANPLLTDPAETIRFNYPDGSNNAETVLVHPQTGDIYVVTKKKIGPAGVFPEGAVDPDAIWRQSALPVDLGDRKQGEGISYGRDGRSLFASSEKKNSPRYVITRPE
jgi:hypothetical protein